MHLCPLSLISIAIVDFCLKKSLWVKSIRAKQQRGLSDIAIGYIVRLEHLTLHLRIGGFLG
jgi:hypothetical protein